MKSSFLKYKEFKIEELKNNISLLEEKLINNKKLLNHIEEQLSIFLDDNRIDNHMLLDNDFDYNLFQQLLEKTKRYLVEDLQEKNRLQKILNKRSEDYDIFVNEIKNKKINDLFNTYKNINKEFDLKRRLNLVKDNGKKFKGTRFYSSSAKK